MGFCLCRICRLPWKPALMGPLLHLRLQGAGRQLSPSPLERGMVRALGGRFGFAWLTAVRTVRQRYPRCGGKHAPVPVNTVGRVTTVG